MAIIECKECKHNISDKASSCPNCGAPITKTKQIKKDNYEEAIIKKERIHPLNTLIYISFFIICSCLENFRLLILFVLVGASNAVNLTDGLDGLAGGVSVVYSGIFIVLISIFIGLSFNAGESDMFVSMYSDIRLLIAIVLLNHMKRL